MPKWRSVRMRAIKQKVEEDNNVWRARFSRHYMALVHFKRHRDCVHQCLSKLSHMKMCSKKCKFYTFQTKGWIILIMTLITCCILNDMKTNALFASNKKGITTPHLWHCQEYLLPNTPNQSIPTCTRQTQKLVYSD